MSNIGERVGDYRRAQRLSQPALARRVGVNPQTIGRLERGEHSPNVQLAQSIAGALGVSISELCGESASSPQRDARTSAQSISPAEMAHILNTLSRGNRARTLEIAERVHEYLSESPMSLSERERAKEIVDAEFELPYKNVPGEFPISE